MAKMIKATIPCSSRCTSFPTLAIHFHGPFYFPRKHQISSLLVQTKTTITSRSSRTRRRLSATGLAIKCSHDVATSSVKLEQSLALKNKAVEVANNLKGTSIFLVGMSGTMKTNVGKLLADLLRYYYFDSDVLVEQAAGGASAAKMYKEKDDKGFRESETEVLKQLSSMGRLLVCAGNGAVQSSTNLAYLRYGISIWIDVPLDILAKEVIENDAQCHSTWDISASDSFPEVLAKLTNLYKEMREGYATADATISLQKLPSHLEYDSVEAVTPEDMVMEALIQIEKLTRVKKMMEDAARPF